MTTPMTLTSREAALKAHYEALEAAEQAVRDARVALAEAEEVRDEAESAYTALRLANCPDPDADADDGATGDDFDPMEALAEAEASHWDDDPNPYHGTMSEGGDYGGDDY